MKLRWIVGGLLSALGTSAWAQVVYTVNGGTPTQLPATNVIALVDPVSTDTLVHVYDSNGVDDSITGQLVIRGEWAGGTLRFQAVNQSVSDAFTFGDPQTPLTEGLRNFGGIRFENPTDPNDTSLRDHATVAVSVQGDITGDIDTGQVWRIDALQSADGTFGGTISGNITAHSQDYFIFQASAPAIAYVRAQRGLLGNITALPPATAGPGSIDTVIVGPLASSIGIQGDIKAERGVINKVT